MSIQRPEQRPDLRQQLRRMGVVRGASNLPPSPRRRVAIESMVEGSFHATPHGQCFVAQASFPTQHRHGDLPLGDFLALAPGLLARIGGESGLKNVDLRHVLFLDTETTGLSGGTGTMAFLVGLGFFADDSFVLQQPFLRDPGDEPALIHWLEERFSRFQALVSFNGRSFDVPILQTRFVLARRPLRLDALPHLDLLAPSRRLWRERLSSCALVNLEREVLGVRRDQADVPSGVIPAIYRDYLRTGDAREIARILYHNQVDILSLATLATLLARSFHDPHAEPAVSGAELYSLARWYESAGGDVEGVLRAALAAGLPGDLRLRALRDLGSWLKRNDRRAEAVEWWQQWAIEDAADVGAAVELAMAFEWHLRRPALAAAWTRLAIGRAGQWRRGAQREQALAELHHRLARLERRLE